MNTPKFFNLKSKQWEDGEIVGQYNDTISVKFSDGSIQRCVAEPMTEQQAHYLNKLGYSTLRRETTITRKNASNLIDMLKNENTRSSVMWR